MSTDRSGRLVMDDDAVAYACQLLGVTSDADTVTLRRAYRRCLLASHPDHGGSQADLAAVQTAYRLLAHRATSTPTVPSDGGTSDGEPVSASGETSPISPEITGDRAGGARHRSARRAYGASDVALRDHDVARRRQRAAMNPPLDARPSLFRRVLERQLRQLEEVLGA